MIDVLLDLRARATTGIFRVGLGWANELAGDDEIQLTLLCSATQRPLMEDVYANDTTRLCITEASPFSAPPNAVIPSEVRHSAASSVYVTPHYELPYEMLPRTIVGAWDDILIDESAVVDLEDEESVRFRIERSLSAADAVVTASQASADRLVSRDASLARKIHIVRPFPPSPPFAPPSNTTYNQPMRLGGARLPGQYLLAVSRHKPHKRLETLIRAWDSAKRPSHDGDRPLLILLGVAAEELPSLMAIVGHYGVADTVYPIRHVPQHELVGAYQRASGVVSPSSKEGFNLPLHEAVRCDTPLIASEIDVHREFFTGVAHFYDTDDEAALAQLITRSLAGSLKKPSQLMTKSWPKMPELIAPLIRTMTDSQDA